jgi:hypothetical protein
LCEEDGVVGRGTSYPRELRERAVRIVAGLLLITQRPSELPDTALVQCGTLVSLRLTNSADHAKFRAALPDSVTGLAAVLLSLGTREAVITGEAVILPHALLAPPTYCPPRKTPHSRRGASRQRCPISRRPLRPGGPTIVNHDRMHCRERVESRRGRGVRSRDRNHPRTVS